MDDLTPASAGRVVLPDGRVLAWREWGDPDGRPLVYCTGAGLTGRLAFGVAAARAGGWRVLAPDRPGLGASSPHPGKTLASWVEDARAWLSELGLRRPAVLGFSQGAPFALALLHAGLAPAGALVAGQDDLHDPALRARLPEDVRAMLARARNDPAGVEAELNGWASPEALWRLVMDFSGPADRDFFAREDFAAAYRAALGEAFSQGPGGYARDTLNALSPWPYRPEEIAAPVAVWYGEEDVGLMHSPDQGARLTARLQHARLAVVPGVGARVLWTHANAILSALAG
ncbi:MAG TPA: alpha/beta hydrolase, partial [Deinococcales bacterium]|nr:alpha/beta hydrolase [Deinococcales bacterium]